MSDTHNTGAKKEREIEEDVMNVPLVAWLGTVASILIAVSVIVLTGIYYLTKHTQQERQQARADERVSDLEAHRQIEAMVVDGYYQQPDVDDGQGNVTRGAVNLPVELGMRKVIETYGK